jgi:hypothetical protein
MGARLGNRPHQAELEGAGMKDIPIIYSGPMVQALLREARAPGTGKTQTRRLATKEYTPRRFWGSRLHSVTIRSSWAKVKVGDRLWVRENWSHTGVGVWTINEARMALNGKPVYAADGQDGPWWPSIHMPREFSRLTLVVTATKVERLQSISDTDAKAEGVVECDGATPDIWYIPGAAKSGWKIQMASRPAPVFKSLWIALHGAEAWDANPEVVALTFTVHLHNIDRMPKAVAA